MFDLKIIVLFVTFGILFGGVMLLLGNEVASSGEYIAPGAEETTPTLGAFDAMKEGLTFNTGVWIIDNWVVSIVGAITAFLIYRAVRGQG
jgi:hypothetical protein